MKPAGESIHVSPFALKFFSQNPAEKTWTCPRCGQIPPIHLRDGWYTRRSCRCEIQAREVEQIRALQRETMRMRAMQTYIWLGRNWSETGLAQKTFATFRAERQPQAYELASGFAQSPTGVLALYGTYGTGKTHLLAAVANTLREQGQACLFASVVSLFDAIQDRIQHGEDYLELLKRAILTPLLLLDDVDKLKPSEFREEVLYKIINGRTTESRPLAISSNTPPSGLEPWIGKAGRSRLMMGLLPVAMNGPDYRLEVAEG